MIDAKDKAKQLVLQFYEVVKNKYPLTNAMPLAKQCAIIEVDEILNVINRDMNYQNVYAYFLEVKTEIQKL